MPPQIRKEDIDDLGPLAQMVVTSLDTIDSYIVPEDRRTIKALKQDPKELILNAINSSDDIAQELVTPATVPVPVPGVAPLSAPAGTIHQHSVAPPMPIPVKPIGDPNQLEFSFVQEKMAAPIKVTSLQEISKDVEKIKSDIKMIKDLVLEIKQNTAKRKRKNEDKTNTRSTESWQAVLGTVSSSNTNDSQ